jgi:hypothetical protein
VPIVLICAFLVVVVVIVVAALGSAGPSRSSRAEPRFDYPALEVAPGSAVPYPGGTVAAEKLAQRTDIPERTVRAYLAAETAMASRAPACKLTWATLAGVGRVESRHGRTGGSAVGADGRLSPPVIGIALDGSPGVRAIRDTDRGRLDGDTAWDRAVGAMQFLPSTWARWATRASSDGAPPDPQNVDDPASPRFRPASPRFRRVSSLFRTGNSRAGSGDSRAGAGDSRAYRPRSTAMRALISPRASWYSGTGCMAAAMRSWVWASG